MQAARGASLSPEPVPDGVVGSASQGHRHRRALVVLAAAAVLAYALDLGTKLLAVDRLTPGRPVELVGSLLRLNLTRNPGAAFSTGTSYTLLITLGAIAAVVVIAYVARRVADPAWAAGLGLLLAGVAGNLTDRVFRAPDVFRGQVVDFLELPHWPVFNLADVCIDVAVAVIVVQVWRGIKVDGRRHEPDGAA
ncbi:MAG: signal peptidase II [Nocardioides sp.]